jgi:hypothetical protein
MCPASGNGGAPAVAAARTAMTPTTRRGSGSWPALARVKGEGLSVARIAEPLLLLPCPTARPERGGTAAVSKSHGRPLRLSHADIVRRKDKVLPSTTLAVASSARMCAATPSYGIRRS